MKNFIKVSIFLPVTYFLTILGLSFFGVFQGMVKDSEFSLGNLVNRTIDNFVDFLHFGFGDLGPAQFLFGIYYYCTSLVFWFILRWGIRGGEKSLIFEILFAVLWFLLIAPSFYFFFFYFLS